MFAATTRIGATIRNGPTLDGRRRLIGGVPVRCREIEYVFANALVAQARQQFWPDDGYGIKMRGKRQSQTNRGRSAQCKFSQNGARCRSTFS